MNRRQVYQIVQSSKAKIITDPTPMIQVCIQSLLAHITKRTASVVRYFKSTVVNVVGPNDSAMTCNQLDTQIAMANKYADDARKEKDMGTGTNISALLFWLPGLWATHKNVEEAVDAANRRAEHLQNLKLKKKCP